MDMQKKIGLLFPGQGSQYVGMGKDLYDNDIGRKVIDDASDYLNTDFKKIIFESDEDKLKQTKNTQLGVFIVSAMYFEQWKKDFSDEYMISGIAGHSLGEYTALYVSEMLSFTDTLSLVNKRAELMSQAVSDDHKMIAILGKTQEDINRLIINGHFEHIWISNINSSSQIVISGIEKELKELVSNGFDDNDYRWLKINGAFHTPLMGEANEKFVEEIEKYSFSNPRYPVLSNYDGEMSQDKNDIINKLKLQMTNCVQWEKTIKNLKSLNVDLLMEVGPGNTLKKICKTIMIRPKCKAMDKQK